MCLSKNDGGRRCPSCLSRRRASLKASLTRAQAKLEEQSSILGDDESTGAKAKLEDRVSLLTMRLAETEAQYDSSAEGMAKLDAKIAEGGDAETLKALKARREQAKKLASTQKEQGVSAAQAKSSFATRMRELGVAEDETQELLSMMSSYTGSPYPKSHAFYSKRLEAAKAKLADGTRAYKLRIKGIAEDGSLSDEAKKTEAEKETARWIAEREELGRGVRNARAMVDGTQEGQAQLRAETDANLSTFEALADAQRKHREATAKRLEVQHALAEAEERNDLPAIYGNQQRLTLAHEAEREAQRAVEQAEFDVQDMKLPMEVSRDGEPQEAARRYAAFQRQRMLRTKAVRERSLSDRRISERFTREVRSVVLSHGGSEADIQVALISYRHPDIAAARPEAIRPPSRVSVRVLVSPEDADQLKALGTSELRQNALMNPTRRTQGKLPTDGVVLESNGKVGRNPTTPHGGTRTEVVRLNLSRAQYEMVKERAAMTHTTTSSYLREMMYRDGNPWRLQNDRSEEQRREKMADFLRKFAA